MGIIKCQHRNCEDDSSGALNACTLSCCSGLLDHLLRSLAVFIFTLISVCFSSSFFVSEVKQLNVFLFVAVFFVIALSVRQAVMNGC